MLQCSRTTSRRFAVGLLAAALAVTASPASPASATAEDLWPVGEHATITLEVDGFGHGIGMSQYGAYGAANVGRSWQQIVDFYYPGTGLGDTGGTVAVRLTADDATLVVDDRSGLRLRALGNGRTFRPHVGHAKRWRVRRDGARHSQVSYKTGRWHAWRRVKGDVELSARGKPLTLRTAEGAHEYRGALRSVSSGDSRVTVNVLPMEAYLRGVVTSEMFAHWPAQALQAQAVASRTYAAYERAHAGSRGWDLCDTSLCQVFGGADAETGESVAAVRATAHRVLTWQGAPAFAQFSASNGGWTVEDDRFDYLPAQEDPFEGTSKDYYGRTVEITDDQIEDAYNIDDLTAVGVDDRDGGGAGHVAHVRLQSAKGFNETVTGTSFMNHLHLRSSMFTITGVE